jgi:amphi-Trp domain-containing protein
MSDKKSDKKIGYKRMIETSEVVTYLEALARSFRIGRLAVEHGEKAVNLEIPPAVVLEIEAKQKKDKAKLEIEISWKHALDEDGAKAISISSESPSDDEEPPPAA